MQVQENRILNGKSRLACIMSKGWSSKHFFQLYREGVGMDRWVQPMLGYDKPAGMMQHLISESQ